MRGEFSNYWFDFSIYGDNYSLLLGARGISVRDFAATLEDIISRLNAGYKLIGNTNIEYPTSNQNYFDGKGYYFDKFFVGLYRGYIEFYNLQANIDFDSILNLLIEKAANNEDEFESGIVIFITNNHSQYGDEHEKGRNKNSLESNFRNIKTGYSLISKLFEEYGINHSQLDEHIARIKLNSNGKPYFEPESKENIKTEISQEQHFEQKVLSRGYINLSSLIDDAQIDYYFAKKGKNKQGIKTAAEYILLLGKLFGKQEYAEGKIRKIKEQLKN